MSERATKLLWVLCVGLSILPFAVFLLVFWFFAIGDPSFEVVWGPYNAAAELLVAYSAERLRVGVLSYGSYLFVHVPVCLSACAYYSLCLNRQRSLFTREGGFEFGFAVVYALAVCGVIVWLTVNDTVFSRLMIAPFAEFPDPPGLATGFEPVATNVDDFLCWAILVPVLPAVFAVVLASAAFHQIVMLRRSRATDENGKVLESPVPLLRMMVTVLSIILVSSVLTSRAYFNLLPALLDPVNKDESSLYRDLAGTLSTASGLLFTATLILAFAPGVVVMVHRVFAPLEDADAKHAKEAYRRFVEGSWYSQMKSVMQTVFTLAAPALATPFMEAIAA